MNELKWWHWLILAALVAVLIYRWRRPAAKREGLAKRAFAAADYFTGGEPPVLEPGDVTLGATAADRGSVAGVGKAGGCGCGCG